MVNRLAIGPEAKRRGEELRAPSGRCDEQMVNRMAIGPEAERKGDTERECAQMVQLPRNLARGE
jgi:hypothetical protein